MILRPSQQAELDKMYSGQANCLELDIVFNVEVNQYNGNKSAEIIMQYY